MTAKLIKPVRYRARVAMSLRQSPDLKSPLYEQWWSWSKGQVFTPPAHMGIAQALERGLMEEADDNG